MPNTEWRHSAEHSHKLSFEPKLCSCGPDLLHAAMPWKHLLLNRDKSCLRELIDIAFDCAAIAMQTFSDASD